MFQFVSKFDPTKLTLNLLIALLLIACQHADSQTLTTLYSFPELANPFGVVIDSQNNIYGTTDGNFCASRPKVAGTAFELATSGTFTELHSFPCGGAAEDPEGLILDPSDNLYGFTAGGADYASEVYELQAPHHIKFDVLFNSHGNTQVHSPRGITRDPGGNLYIATNGGTGDSGTIFEISSAGNSVIHNFAGPPSDGSLPENIIYGGGNLYGITHAGGAYNIGTAYELSLSGTETMLYSFCSQFPACPDGQGPSGELALDGQGNMYGVAVYGGNTNSDCDAGCGVVFKVTSSGQQSVLHSFTGGTDGQYPLGVVMDANENLYGTTYFGGVNNCGIVYELTAASGYTSKLLLYSFTGASDGCTPSALAIDAEGNLYGTTTYDGGHGYGTVFKLTP